MPNTALVFGGSGLIGRHLLRRLIDSDHWDCIIAVTRRSLNTGSDKVAEVIADTTNIEEVAGELAADTVFCCLGTTQKLAGSRENFRSIDHDYILRCAEISQQQGAKRFLVVSTVGADVESANFYFRVKGETERDLQSLAFETLDILQPSALIGERDSNRRLEAWNGRILQCLSFLMVGPLRKYRPIRGEQVAKAMSSIALQKHVGVVVHTSSELASY